MSKIKFLKKPDAKLPAKGKIALVGVPDPYMKGAKSALKIKSSRVRRRYKRAALKLSALFDQVTSILVTNDNPQFRSAAVNLPEYNDWDFGAHWYADYVGDRSANHLWEWVVRGGLPAHVSGRKGSFIVVRLISSVKQHSCFGVSFDCKNGRKFSIVANETVRNSQALRLFFNERGAKLTSFKRKRIESYFKNAPCHLVLPVI